jgi:hypothetical protein
MIIKYFEINENEAYENLQDAARAVFRWELMGVNS